MHCKHCGKAIGTDRGICPFCGAMLTGSQMKKFIEDKKENMYKPDLITEKYGMKPYAYEKNKTVENKLLGFLIVVGVLLFLIVLVLIFVLNN